MKISAGCPRAFEVEAVVIAEDGEDDVRLVVLAVLANIGLQN